MIQDGLANTQFWLWAKLGDFPEPNRLTPSRHTKENLILQPILCWKPLLFFQKSHMLEMEKRGEELYIVFIIIYWQFRNYQNLFQNYQKIMKCKNLIYTFFRRCKLCFHALLRVISASNIGPTNHFWYALLVQTKHSKVRLFKKLGKGGWNGTRTLTHVCT